MAAAHQEVLEQCVELCYKGSFLNIEQCMILDRIAVHIVNICELGHGYSCDLRLLRNTAVLVRADTVAPEGACLHETHGCLRKTLGQSSGMLMAHQMVLRLLVAGTCGARWIHLHAAVQSGLGHKIRCSSWKVGAVHLHTVAGHYQPYWQMHIM